TLYRSTDLVQSCIESPGELISTTPCPSAIRNYVGPDFDWRPGLFGLGAMARKIVAGPGWLQLTGFLSRAVHNIYQYEIYDPSHCADPNDDADPACAAPPVY